MRLNEKIRADDSGQTEFGLVHVIIGEGKGKTTSALGMTLRAVGDNKYVKFVQFYKHESAEQDLLRQICEYSRFSETHPFFILNLEARPYEIDRQRPLFQSFWKKEIMEGLADGKYDMLVLDEIGSALAIQIMGETELIEFIKNKPKKTELVLTGRWIPDSIIEHADYAGNIVKIKHPYDLGFPARKGIEF